MTEKSRAPLLEAVHLCQTYRLPNGETLDAVKDVSFTVRRGETVALVGESGSGKSSIARMVLGLTTPTSGDILLNGHEITHLSKQPIPWVRRMMQPVFQDPSTAFNPRKTVYQSIAQAVKQTGSAENVEDKVAEALDQVSLRPAKAFFNRFPHELSGGQRQRLAIARALACDAELIIADEPLSGADVSIRGRVLNLLLDLQEARGVSYLFITHDMAVAHSFAHRVLVMYRGEIIEQGPSEEVFRSPRHDYTRLLIEAGSFDLAEAARVGAV